jgi:hypothetical protein
VQRSPAELEKMLEMLEKDMRAIKMCAVAAFVPSRCCNV